MQGIISESGLVVFVNDDEKKIYISVPTKDKENFIIIDEQSIKMEDVNGNKIEMTDSGVCLTAEKDITIKGKTVKINGAEIKK